MSFLRNKKQVKSTHNKAFIILWILTKQQDERMYMLIKVLIKLTFRIYLFTSNFISCQLHSIYGT